MIKDIQFAVRSLLKRPGFTAIVVISLALGIGVNAALFPVFNLFLRPKPVREPETIVRLALDDDLFSFPQYTYLSDHNQSFAAMVALFEHEKFLLGENKPHVEPEELLGNFVSDNYFEVFGSGRTHLGRYFTSEENTVTGRDA